MTHTPLTDEQFEATTAFLLDIDFLDDEQHKGAVGAFIADARSCRAELAKARAENERLREALTQAKDYLVDEIDGAIRVACPWVRGDTQPDRSKMDEISRPMIEDMEKLLSELNAALATEGKEKP